MFPLSRRAFLRGSAAVAVTAGAAPSMAQVLPGESATRFSSIAVDVSRLRQLGAGPLADLVESVMLSELRRVFADRLGGRGPRLVVRITSLSLNSSISASGNPASDYLDGEALIVGPRGEVLARIPQLLAHPTAPGGEQRRATAAAQAYAAWLQRRIR